MFDLEYQKLLMKILQVYIKTKGGKKTPEREKKLIKKDTLVGEKTHLGEEKIGKQIK